MRNHSNVLKTTNSFQKPSFCNPRKTCFFCVHLQGKARRTTPFGCPSSNRRRVATPPRTHPPTKMWMGQEDMPTTSKGFWELPVQIKEPYHHFRRISRFFISQVWNPAAYISFPHSQAKTRQTNKITEHSGPDTHTQTKVKINYLDP